MTKTTLYFTRHGETEWNVQGRIMGQQDSPLTDLGIQQVRWLRDALKDEAFSAIYASSSPRTIASARILRATRQLSVIADDRLREIDLGSWEGYMGEEIANAYPDEVSAYRYDPLHYQASNGGETFVQVQQRIMPCIETLISRHEGEKILIVTHGIALKIVLLSFENRSLEYLRQPPIVLWASLSKVVVENGAPTIELYADTSHYKTPDTAPIQAKNVQDG